MRFDFSQNEICAISDLPSRRKIADALFTRSIHKSCLKISTKSVISQLSVGNYKEKSKGDGNCTNKLKFPRIDQKNTPTTTKILSNDTMLSDLTGN